MDGLLKRNQQVRPAGFCCRDLFLLHDNAPAHKATSVCQFLTQKILTTIYHSPYTPNLSPPDLFSVPKVENEVQRTPLCGSR